MQIFCKRSKELLFLKPGTSFGTLAIREIRAAKQTKTLTELVTHGKFVAVTAKCLSSEKEEH